MKRIFKRIIPVLLVLLMLPGTALAAVGIDKNQDVKLTISYQYENTPLSGAVFSIYKVAAVDETGELTPTEAFRQLPVNFGNQNDEEWKALASTLEGYVFRNGIQPTDSGTTDEKGILTFQTEKGKLTQGLYLILGNRHTQGGYYYDAAPCLVMLPTEDVKADKWLYEVTVKPKYEATQIPDEPVTMTRRVLKVWKDAGYEQSRPKEVVVQLFRNGRLCETVTLNRENNWRYTWDNLEESDTWTVVEKEVENYTVTTALEGTTFVVTNTYSGATDNTPNKGKLPQTGVLWWPVPVLICGGLLFLILGALKNKHDEGK